MDNTLKLIRTGLLLTLVSILSIHSAVQSQLLNLHKDVGWAFHENLTKERFDALFLRYSEMDYILIDVETYRCGLIIRHSMVWQQNTYGTNWAAHVAMTLEEFSQYREVYETGMDFRLYDIEVFWEAGSEILYSAIWIENDEDLSWSVRFDMTESDFTDERNQQISNGFRPVDVELYDTPDGLRIAALWIENHEDAHWFYYHDLTSAEFQGLVDQYDEEYRVLDHEAYLVDGEQRFAGIWEQRPPNRLFISEAGLSEWGFANAQNRYIDLGYRQLDFEYLEHETVPYYGGIWVDNDLQLFSVNNEFTGLFDGIHDMIANYGIVYGIPGISVAINLNGNMVYVGGHGNARETQEDLLMILAHGRTVYPTASVSKVIAATLAAKLEAEGQLSDGTAVDLDLSRETRFYLPDAPSHHTHTLEQLLAHLGCVAHWDTSSTNSITIPRSSSPFESATEWVESIWDIGLVENCVVGQDRNYSTASFSFVGAALESLTGRTDYQLIEDEIANQFDLGSIRAHFPGGYSQSNPLRADPFSRNNARLPSHYNTSGTLFGGGIEANVVDLAKFGWLVINGEIVSDEVRDNRLLQPVVENCNTPGFGICSNGLGWLIQVRNNRRAASHGGTGAASGAYLRIYPDDGLTIAMLSNRVMSDSLGNRDGLTSDLASLIFDHPLIEKQQALISGRRDEIKDAPDHFKLMQNYPNPFNPTTTVPFSVPEDMDARLAVYNLLGQEVAVLVDGRVTAGYHAAEFDATRLSSGVYIYRLSTGGRSVNRKMLLVK